MPKIVVNHIQLEPEQLRSIKMYISITKQKTYKQCQTKNAAKQIIKFMRGVYLKDHPFDELDFSDDVLTASSLVANMVVPTKVNSLSSLIEIAIDFDNMLALNQKNYERYYFGSDEPFTPNQLRLIETKTDTVIKRYAASNTLERKPVDKLLESNIKVIEETDGKVKKQASKNVCQFSKDGVLIAVYFNARTAANITKTNLSNIASCCRGQKHSANGFVWRYRDDIEDVIEQIENS